MAAYGAQIEQGKTEAQAIDYVGKLFKNVAVQDKSARESLQNFTGGKGDAIISYENETITAKQKGERLDYVIPNETILIENPIAATAAADAKATAFVDYAVSQPAQKVFAAKGCPPGDRLARRREDLPGAAQAVRHHEVRRLGHGHEEVLRPTGLRHATDRAEPRCQHRLTPTASTTGDGSCHAGRRAAAVSPGRRSGAHCDGLPQPGRPDPAGRRRRGIDDGFVGPVGRLGDSWVRPHDIAGARGRGRRRDPGLIERVAGSASRSASRPSSATDHRFRSSSRAISPISWSCVPASSCGFACTRRASSRQDCRVRVSAKVDYAVRASIELAAAQNGADPPRPVKAEALGRAQDIPVKFLENILQGLRQAA
jgi:hypothetical protein